MRAFSSVFKVACYQCRAYSLPIAVIILPVVTAVVLMFIAPPPLQPRE
jgi:hypothetical protein